MINRRIAMSRTNIGALVIILLAGGCVDMPGEEEMDSAHPFVGTWEQIGARAILADTVFTWDFLDRESAFLPLKMVSDNYFAFVHPRPQGDSVWYAGKGRVMIDEDLQTYTEVIDFHTESQFTGTGIEFTYRFEDSLWVHVNPNSQIWDEGLRYNRGERTYAYEELWRKVD